MAPRDEHEYEQRRQQIINGALKVFARKGFEKATNKDIAEAAEIGSPGLIYHYFKDKEDLFQRVVEQHMPLIWLISQPETFMDWPPREALSLVARTFLKVADNRLGLAALKLVLSEAVRRPEVANMINQVGPGRGIPVLKHYLQKQMDAGTLRQMNADAAVRCFIGPILAYLMTREIFRQPDALAISPDTMVETTVEIFLRGMQPDTPPAPPSDPL